MPLMQDSQPQLLAVVLRQFHVALKTYGLYSAQHAVAQSILPGLGATIQGYLQTRGPLTIQVGRDRLGIGAETLQDGGAASLAYYLYLRNVASMTIFPGVSEQELGTLLAGLSHDRQTLDALGGIERVLVRADLPHIVVTGVALSQGEQSGTEIDALTGLLNGDRLSGEQRDLVVEILRGGPEATARLLTALYELAVQSERDPLPSLFQALEVLDRTILDEPLEDQEPLFATLARAHLLLDEPLRSDITRELIGHAAEGGVARTVVAQLSGDEIAQLVLGLPDHSAVGTQISTFLEQLNVLPAELSEIVASLQPALAARGVAVEPPAPPQAPAGDSIEDGWAEIPPEMLELLPGEERSLHEDVSRLAEPFVVVDTVMTLINLIHLEDEPEQLVETASVLAGYTPALADSGRLDLVASTLRVLREAAGRAGQHRAGVEAAIVRVLDEGVLDLLVAAGLAEGDSNAATARQALREVAPDAVPKVIRLLDREPRATRRRQLCRLLADVARDDPDLVGMHIPSPTWHLTRNLVFVMGEVGSADGIRHILRVSRSSDFRVRREVLDALRKVDDATSRTALLGFFDDPEPRIQHHLIETIGAGEDPRAGDRLLRIVKDGDVSPGGVVLKTAAMRALARMRYADALPVIERLARARWAFGRNRRALREAARQIAIGWRTPSAR
jgi:hypothetical protein